MAVRRGSPKAVDLSGAVEAHSKEEPRLREIRHSFLDTMEHRNRVPAIIRPPLLRTGQIPLAARHSGVGSPQALAVPTSEGDGDIDACKLEMTGRRCPVLN
jgi:hypothetical protein